MTTETTEPKLIYSDYLDVALSLSALMKRPELTKADLQLLELSQAALHKFSYSTDTGEAMRAAWDEKYRSPTVTLPATADEAITITLTPEELVTEAWGAAPVAEAAA